MSLDTRGVQIANASINPDDEQANMQITATVSSGTFYRIIAVDSPTAMSFFNYFPIWLECIAQHAGPTNIPVISFVNAPCALQTMGDGISKTQHAFGTGQHLNGFS